MLKNVIAPIQAWFLYQRRCVGCGMPLGSGKKEKHTKGTKVTCKCGRIYIEKDGKYRRATFAEV